MADLGTIGIAIEVRGREALRQIESDMGVVDKTAKSAARSFEAFERAGLKTADTFKYMSDASKKRLAEEQKITQELIKQRSAAEQLARANAQKFQSQIGSNLGLGARGASSSSSASTYEAELERLKQKYDKVYSASRLYEQQLNEINRAESLGAISTKQMQQELDKLNLEYQQFADAAEGAYLANNRFSQHVNEAGRGLNNFGMYAQQVGYQVGDFFVQVQSGTNFLVAFGQQATQLAGLFPGVLGAALGIGISVMTALGAAIMRTSGETKSLSESLSDLESAVNSVSEVTDIYSSEGIQRLLDKYGELDQQVLSLVANQTAYANLLASKELKDGLSALQTAIGPSMLDIGISNYASSLITLQETFKVTEADAKSLKYAFDEVAKAKTYDEQANALVRVSDYLYTVLSAQENVTDEQMAIYDATLRSLAAVQELSANQPKQGWLAAAIGEAKSLATALWDAAAAKVAATTSELAPGSSPRPMRRGQGEIIDLRSEDPLGGGGSGGGGGGGSVDPIENRMQEVYKYLEQDKYLIEQENLAYQERQITLEESLRQKLVTLEEYNQLEKDLKTKHEADLSAIEQKSWDGRLAEASGFFGALASVVQGGGSKANKAYAAVAAVESTIDAYRAAIKAAAEAKTPWGRVGAYLSVLGTLMKGVSAIKSAGGSGGGGGGSVGSATVASSASAPAPQTVFIDSLDPDGLYTGQALINLFDAFYDENDKRGKVFMVAR